MTPRARDRAMSSVTCPASAGRCTEASVGAVRPQPVRSVGSPSSSAGSSAREDSLAAAAREPLPPTASSSPSRRALAAGVDTEPVDDGPRQGGRLQPAVAEHEVLRRALAIGLEQ